MAHGPSANGSVRAPTLSTIAGDVDAALERVVRRERIAVLAALTLVVVLSWVYLLAGAGMGMSALEMTRMGVEVGTGEMWMMPPLAWTVEHAVVMFFMWWIMMVAMMLPSAAPMILLFAAVQRKQKQRGDVYVSSSLFAFAYLVVWAAFSALAVALQWGLQSVGWLTPMLASNSTGFSAALLLLAGAYQLTPIKQACLRHCRSPFAFISRHWRRGWRGAFSMGLRHGAFCVGCCWFLMGLLFFGGVMNLWWIVGLALFVLFEKTVPAGHWLGAVSGVVLLSAGGWMLIA